MLEKYPEALERLYRGYVFHRRGEEKPGDPPYTRCTGSAGDSTLTASTSAPGRAAGGRRASPFRNIRYAICSKRALNTIPR